VLGGRGEVVDTMSMRPMPWPDVPPETAVVARAAFPKGTLAIRLRDMLGSVFADGHYAGAFGVRGRPGIAPGQLMLVTVLQFVEDLTDRQAVEAVAGRIDWKYALGLKLSDPGFDFSVLSQFRTRLVDNDLERAGFDAVLERCRELGLVKAGGKARTDSTHVLSAVRDLNRSELAGESVRALVEVLAQVAPDWLAGTVDIPEWSRRYGMRIASWSGPSSKAGREELTRQYGRDGHALLRALHRPTVPPWLRELPQVEVLRTVLVQNFLVQWHTDGRQVIRRREKSDGLPPGAIRLASPWDTDARWAAKGDDLFWLGYKLHLTETCDDPVGAGRRDTAPNLITNVVTTDAAVPDSAVTERIHADLAACDLNPAEHYLDSGYPSAAGVLKAREHHGIDIVAPLLADTSPQARADNGYQRSDFMFDYATRTATCPQGHASSAWTGCSQRGTPAIVATFAVSTCRPCPVREQCTTAKRGSRQLTVPPREVHELQQLNRAAQNTRAWQDKYKRRAGVEGTMHQAVTTVGLRQARYRGHGKVRLEHYVGATAINLLRLDAHFTEHPLDRGHASHLTRLGMALAT
jgi:transposase